MISQFPGLYSRNDSIIWDWHCSDLKTNLVLIWEKCYFMVHEAIVLEHLILARGIEEA